MKKIWIKTATLEDFKSVEIGDWVEGVGTILTHFEKSFIRRYGNHHLTSAMHSNSDNGVHLEAPDYPMGSGYYGEY